MATVIGGIFDPETNPNADPVQGALISAFLDSLGLSESDLEDAEIFEGGTIISTDDLSTIQFGDFDSEEPLLVNVPFLTQPLKVSIPATDTSPGFTFIFGGFSIIDALQALTNGGGALSDEQAQYLLDAAEEFGAGEEMLADLAEGLRLLSENGDALPEDLLVNFIRLAQSADSDLSEILLDVSDIDEDFLLAAYLPDLGDTTLALAGMEKILVLGEGTVRIEGDDAGMIVGDTFEQVVIGGGGADTLVGGGGDDTLTGGGGDDVFGFNALGHYTITDFDEGADVLAFEVSGVTTKAELEAFLTSVSTTGGDTTFNFGTDASITLVGVTATGLFDDMLFNIS